MEGCEDFESVGGDLKKQQGLISSIRQLRNGQVAALRNRWERLTCLSPQGPSAMRHLKW